MRKNTNSRRRDAKYAIEDTTNGVGIPVSGNFETIRKEAFKLCEYKNAPVNIYVIDGDVWTLEGEVRP